MNVLDKEYNMDKIVELAKYQNSLKANDVKISVVIPNYNYERFILERLYSILYQDVKIYELIFLDDFSNDNSREFFEIIKTKIGRYINIKCEYNDKNSGSAFSQWNKGINIATGDYIWIAETDDYCAKNFLSEVMMPISKEDNICISFCDSSLIDLAGNIILDSVKKMTNPTDIAKYNNDYILCGNDCIKNGYCICSPIINVSSCIIKKGMYDDMFKEAILYKHSGDWIFYLNVIKNKKISFVNKSLNYYRQHNKSITGTMEKSNRLAEIKSIHRYFLNKFNLSENEASKMVEYERVIADKWSIS